MNGHSPCWTGWAALLVRLFLGGFYVVAGGLKVANPGQFADAVANYRLGPHELINLVAITLPWIEIVAGLFLMLGIWANASAWLINAMTVLFIGAITSAVARGLSIECGCFGTVGGRKTGLKAIAEDSVLLACGLWLVWVFRHRRAKGSGHQNLNDTPHENGTCTAVQHHDSGSRRLGDNPIE